MMLRLVAVPASAAALLLAPRGRPRADAADAEGLLRRHGQRPAGRPGRRPRRPGGRHARRGVESWRVELAWDPIEPDAAGSSRPPRRDRKVLGGGRAPRASTSLGLALRAPAWASRATRRPPVHPAARPPTTRPTCTALIARYGPHGLAVGRAPGGPDARRSAPGRSGTSRTSKNYFAAQPFAKPYARAAARRLPGGQGADPGATVADGRRWPTTRGATSPSCSRPAARGCASTPRARTRSAGRPSNA